MPRSFCAIRRLIAAVIAFHYIGGRPAWCRYARWEEFSSSMIRVEARSGEPLDKTLRRFKKQCEKEGLTKDMKKISYYEKPSERKRRKLRQSEKSKDKGR